MKSRPVADLHSADTGEPGDFEIYTTNAGRRIFWFVCPGACKSIIALMLDRGLPGKTWQLQGGGATPTLTPSINHIGCWHGWLRAGEFIEA